MKDQEQLSATLLLMHQNQVVLAESVQLLSAWFLRSGLTEVATRLQPMMEQVMANCVWLDRALGDDIERYDRRLRSETLGQIVSGSHR
ncbi:MULTISPECIES: hypothetical protein [unclassified Pseudomonas]|uniref:hypothetical protein n=1 Tax=unclassified Pseudomonas TaxID=196821 RepID=UPI00244C66F3|nr:MULTISPECIES: hypothetical protein [unclassified Pseudomonas]MDG9922952.1 hypothetical protein [Pseudomonas sp. GD04045]MDH0035684.1 hypothetical protein [Pseudomonas sp. GD04019]